MAKKLQTDWARRRDEESAPDCDRGEEAVAHETTTRGRATPLPSSALVSLLSEKTAHLPRCASRARVRQRSSMIPAAHLSRRPPLLRALARSRVRTLARPRRSRRSRHTPMS
ncbi:MULTISPECIES: hypothetical protein [Sorangium]|uniref:hypothetical protein n=1 Tax=Sorangium TaxID=39643 RepID=UPI003D9C4B88